MRATVTPRADTLQSAEGQLRCRGRASGWRTIRVVRGPPISVTCECGERRDLAYGERWTCESCGRVWNTEQIPADEYGSLVRDLRRYKLQMLVAAVVVLVILLALVVFVDEGLVFVVPVLVAILAIFYGPFWKKKVRRRIAERPRWNLEPE